MKIILRPVVLVLLLSATTLVCAGQKQADELRSITEAIARSNTYDMSYTIGFAGTVSKQYLRFKQLASEATEQELTDLAARDNSPVVRLYAFQALKHKQTNIPAELRRQFRNDMTQVRTMNGCVAGSRSVSELSTLSLRPVTE